MRCSRYTSMDDLTIAICNFNTTELTNDAIRSAFDVGLYAKKTVVLDNSTTQKFRLDNDLHEVTVLDNTYGKYIDFQKVMQTFSTLEIKANANGSLKHCYSIQFLLNACHTRHMLMLDSDVIFHKKPDFIDDNVITSAEIEREGQFCKRCNKIFAGKTRFAPILQYFNVAMTNAHHLTYYNPMMMHGGLSKQQHDIGNYYDTGAWFYEQVNKRLLKYHEIKYEDYITHLNHGSWK